MEPTEITLDPSDWEEFRRLAHRMVDESLDHLATLRDKPAWRPMPEDVRAGLREAVPRDGQGAAAAYDAFRARVLPYPNGNLHPRFFGWVQGNGTPLGMMADMLAACINPHMAGFNQAPALVEDTVIRWLTELMGFPSTSSGILALGGSMANILGLAVARHAKAGYDLREHGLQGRPTKMTVYASEEVHGWLPKGMELLGLGRACLRCIRVDRDYRIDLGALRAAVAADRAANDHPICVVASAGTVNTGATDPLEALSDFTRREGLWLHVDGAFGALARWSEQLQAIVAGIERADSLAFDLHKWGYQPFDVACLLVRDGDAHRAAFSSAASYLASMDRGVMAGGLPFAQLGVDLTRGFRALKVWMSLKAHGVRTFARLFEQNIEQAQYIAERVRGHDALELLAPVPMNVVCFRYNSRDLPEEKLDTLNEEVLLRLQESGIAVPSSTILNGRFAIRCAIVNHRTRRADLDELIDATVRFGKELATSTGRQ